MVVFKYVTEDSRSMSLHRAVIFDVPADVECSRTEDYFVNNSAHVSNNGLFVLPCPTGDILE
jgi:hypothetical protein